MSTARQSEVEVLQATVRHLTEQGYDVVVEPAPSLLPPILRDWRPDAVALGRSPKLIVEIASENPRSAERVAALQKALQTAPDWKLHLVLNRSAGAADLAFIDDAEIEPVLDRIPEVARIGSRAALLMSWAALEALSRSRGPAVFGRPQSPGRIIERLAAGGVIGSEEAAFLRSMAQRRNGFVHGDLRQSVTAAEVDRFVTLIRSLIASTDFRNEFEVAGQSDDR